MTAIEFIQGKIADAEKALKSRLEMQRAWRSGTTASWKAVGCNLSKKERIANSDMQSRIAAKKLQELNMFKTVLEELEKGKK